MNVIVRIEFELTYSEVAIQHFSNYIMGTLQYFLACGIRDNYCHEVEVEVQETVLCTTCVTTDFCEMAFLCLWLLLDIIQGNKPAISKVEKAFKKECFGKRKKQKNF